MSDHCCTPGPLAGLSPTSSATSPLPAPTGADRDHGLVPVPGGVVSLGDHLGEGYVGDGEGPVHDVTLTPFHLGATTVTNAEFAAFVDATRHVTTAEREGYSAVFHLDVRAPARAVLGRPEHTPWWVGVAGADWRHPEGPLSDVEARLDHPVVHVSHDDALAYAAWAGLRLPSEAEWEAAARGGLRGARFAWGDELMPAGRWPCNIYQGRFPAERRTDDGWATTAPVRSYEPNGFGLFQMSGNVWEWCSDWFAADAYAHRAEVDPPGPTYGTTRVMRGGSFLCHDSYCHRYRVSARSSSPPDSTASNLGFRCASG